MGAADIPAPRRGEPSGAMVGFKKKDPAARLRRELAAREEEPRA